jgi:hypothetical protein
MIQLQIAMKDSNPISEAAPAVPPGIKEVVLNQDGSRAVPTTGEFVNSLLTDPQRRTVYHSYSLHTMEESLTGSTIRVHYVMKFKFDLSLITEGYIRTNTTSDACLTEEINNGVKANLDDKTPCTIQRFNSSFHLYPYCLFNSTDETPISWAMSIDKSGVVKERIEMFVNFTVVDYKRYFPFELKVLCLKVGNDGMGKTNLLNLVPEQNKEGVPNADFGVFTKSTSSLQIAEPAKAIEKSDVICRMVIRDNTVNNNGNNSGVFTRVYTAFFFESGYAENMLKFVGLSTVLMNVTVMFSSMEKSELVGNMLAIVFSQLALLFILPHHQITTAGVVVVVQTMFTLAFSFVLWSLAEAEIAISAFQVWVPNVIVTLLTGLHVLNERKRFTRLKEQIKSDFKGVHPLVSSFGPIDKQI